MNKTLNANQSGMTLIEFALIIALVVVVLLPFISIFENSAKEAMNNDAQVLNQAHTLGTTP